MRQFRVLATSPLAEVDSLSTPERADISMDSPALDVFTDFRQRRPLVVDANTGIIEAESMMAREHVRLKLVVDHAERFIGAVGFRDLYGERFQRQLGQGRPRTEIVVKDVMVPRAELLAIEHKDFMKAKVGDLVETLKQEHSQHFLVVDTAEHEIRGIVSAGDLARRLHVPIDISTAPSFAEICHAMSNQLKPTNSAY